MNPPEERQLEIDFASGRGEGGFNQWREQRRAAMRELARKLGLPLDHPVEVWLIGGIRLRGIMRLREEKLFVDEGRDPALEFLVDEVPFKAAEIESCVRTDC